MAASLSVGVPLAPWLVLLAAAAMLNAPATVRAQAQTQAQAQAQETPLRGELRLRWDARSANPHGPLAEAQALAPGMAPPTPSAAVAEAGLQATLRHKPFTLQADLLAWAQRPEGAGSSTSGTSGARVNELHLSTERGAWAASAGKKVVGWDVGYGFRPNDVVQQEQRRSLLATPLEGRPLLQLEHFGADDAATLVWVNPQRLNTPADASRGAHESMNMGARESVNMGAHESALAARWYTRRGALDAHAFARLGEHTRASAGLALAWVGGDALELHASARALQRHDGWHADTTPAPSANPWVQATRGGTTQWLLGAQWTGEQQQSLLVEAWHDGTALPDGEWQAWRERNTALASNTALPTTARAGALAWQATPFDAPNLRQDNLYLRLAWQPGAWTASVDALLQPRDRGAMLSAGLQWQGDRLRLNAALRQYAGAANALVRQLPQRRTALLAATVAF